MLFELVMMALAMATLVIASFTDLKTREVPDWLNYGLIFAALGIRFIYSFDLGWQIILSGLLGFVACFVLACLFYYTHQWGGGDSKLLMGMGAVIGITYPLNNSSFLLLWFFLALLLLGAFFGVMWMGVLAMKRKEQFMQSFKNNLGEYRGVHIGAGALSLSFAMISFGFMPLWPMAVLPIAFFYLFTFVTAVERSCFISAIDPMKLTAGDWLAEDVSIEGKTVVAKKTLEMTEVEKLKHLKRQGKLSSVVVKEGIPFVPAFLLAYVFIVIGGEMFSWVWGVVFG